MTFDQLCDFTYETQDKVVLDKETYLFSTVLFRLKDKENNWRDMSLYLNGLKKTQVYFEHLSRDLNLKIVLRIYYDQSPLSDSEFAQWHADVLKNPVNVGANSRFAIDLVKFNCPRFIDPSNQIHYSTFGTLLRYLPFFNNRDQFKFCHVVDLDLQISAMRLYYELLTTKFLDSGYDFMVIGPIGYEYKYSNYLFSDLLDSSVLAGIYGRVNNLDSEILTDFLEASLSEDSKEYQILATLGRQKMNRALNTKEISRYVEDKFSYGVDELFLNRYLIDYLKNQKFNLGRWYFTDSVFPQFPKLMINLEQTKISDLLQVFRKALGPDNRSTVMKVIGGGSGAGGSGGSGATSGGVIGTRGLGIGATFSPSQDIEELNSYIELFQDLLYPRAVRFQCFFDQKSKLPVLSPTLIRRISIVHRIITGLEELYLNGRLGLTEKRFYDNMIKHQPTNYFKVFNLFETIDRVKIDAGTGTRTGAGLEKDRLDREVDAIIKRTLPGGDYYYLEYSVIKNNIMPIQFNVQFHNYLHTSPSPSTDSESCSTCYFRVNRGTVYATVSRRELPLLQYLAKEGHDPELYVQPTVKNRLADQTSFSIETQYQPFNYYFPVKRPCHTIYDPARQTIVSYNLSSDNWQFVSDYLLNRDRIVNDELDKQIRQGVTDLYQKIKTTNKKMIPNHFYPTDLVFETSNPRNARLIVHSVSESTKLSQIENDYLILLQLFDTSADKLNALSETTFQDSITNIQSESGSGLSSESASISSSIFAYPDEKYEKLLPISGNLELPVEQVTETKIITVTQPVKRKVQKVEVSATAPKVVVPPKVVVAPKVAVTVAPIKQVAKPVTVAVVKPLTSADDQYAQKVLEISQQTAAAMASKVKINVSEMLTEIATTGVSAGDPLKKQVIAEIKKYLKDQQKIEAPERRREIVRLASLLPNR